LSNRANKATSDPRATGARMAACHEGIWYRPRAGAALPTDEGLSLFRVLGLAAILAIAVLAIAARPALALPAGFGTNGPGAGQIEGEAQGIAVDQSSGDVYVADRGNARIDKFGPEGEFLLAFGWGVVDGSPELQVCTTSCRAGLPGSGVGQFSSLEGIAVDNSADASQGDVYVVDAGNSRVEKFGPAGNFILAFGEEGTGPGQFDGLNGRSVAVGSTGTVYVGDRNRVQRFDEAGTLLGEIAIPATGRTLSLVVDSVGDIYRISGEVEGAHKYDPSGVELGTPRDEAGTREFPSLSIGPSDELFLEDWRGGEFGHHIFTYEPAGTQIASFDRGGLEQAGRALAYSEHTGALYVLNPGHVRIVTPPPPGPFVLPGSESATEVGTTSATLNATINAEDAATTYHFQYGTTTSYGETTPAATLEAVDEVQTVSVKATSGDYLLRFRGEATIEIPFDAEASVVQAELETLPAVGAGNVSVTAPAAGTYAVEFITALGGSVQPRLEAESVNLRETTEVEGEERTKPGTVSVATTRPGADFFADRPVSAPLTGLQPGTTYHFRVVAENADGTATGPDQAFTTLPPVSIDAVFATGVTAGSATLGAELNPHGLATTYVFQYGTSTAYDTEAPLPPGSAGTGTTDVTRTLPIQGLAPATTYHFRVIARNALGESISTDRVFITEGPAAALLPDGRAWEMVTPPDKFGSPLEPITEEGGLIQAAADGSAFTEVTLGPLGPHAAGVRSPSDSQWLSAREPDGWSTQDISTPNEEITLIGAGEPAEYKFFSDDLGSGFVEPAGATRLAPTNLANTERTPYLRESGGSFRPLVDSGNVPPGTHFGGEHTTGGGWINGVSFETATPDGRHVILQSTAPLGGDTATGSLYEWSSEIVTPVGVLPNGEGTAAGAGAGGSNRRGAISDDGSRVFFTGFLGGSHLYLRVNALQPPSPILGSATDGSQCTEAGKACTILLDEVQSGAGGGGGPAVFQAASADGRRVFFTDTSRLTADSTAQPVQPDLYMCEVVVSAGHPACRLSDLSVDHNPGESASVSGGGEGFVSAVDGSGTHVYFVANGVLTNSANPAGETAVPGHCESSNEQNRREESFPCNLYTYDVDTHRLSLVAVLSSLDGPDWGPRNISRGLASLTARSSPDGHWFAFMSRRSLTGYDNRDAAAGRPDEEVYLFDAVTGALRCASCDPTGARPRGILITSEFPGSLVDHPATWGVGRAGGGRWVAASVPGWTSIGSAGTQSLYQSRYVSNSGRLFFNSADSLVPSDTNGVMDVYQYEPPGVGGCSTAGSTFSAASGGCVGLISSGTSPDESAFLDASESGDDVFFLTASQLVKKDTDSAYDIYDAAVGGGEPEVASPPECDGDACQQPAVAPHHATPGTLGLNGLGNPVVCRKGKQLKKGKCVKQKPKKKHHKKSHKKHKKGKGKKSSRQKTTKNKRARANRGGAK
jgi:hypothetical protein